MNIKQLIDISNKHRSLALQRNEGYVKLEPTDKQPPIVNKNDISPLQEMEGLVARVEMRKVKNSLQGWQRNILGNYTIRRCIQFLTPINSIQVHYKQFKHKKYHQANMFNQGISIIFQQDSHLQMKIRFYDGEEEGGDISYTYHITDSTTNHQQLYIHSQHDIEHFLNIKTIGGCDMFEELGRKICVIESRLCYIPLHQHLVQNKIRKTQLRDDGECEVQQLADCMKVFCRKASFKLSQQNPTTQWTIKLELKKLNFGKNGTDDEEIDFRSSQLYPTSTCVQNFLRIISDVMILYKPVQQFSLQMMRDKHVIIRHLFEVESFDFNVLTIRYFASSYQVRIGCNSSRRLVINIPEGNPHKRMEDILDAQLNRTMNILSLVYTLVYTCAPLLSIGQLEKGCFAISRKDGSVEKQFKLFFVDSHNFQISLYNRFNLCISCSDFNSVDIRDLHATSTHNQILFRKMLPVPRLKRFVQILHRISPVPRFTPPSPPSVGKITLSHQEFDHLCTPNPHQSYLEKYLLAALNMNSLVSALRVHKLVFNELPLAVIAAYQAQIARPLRSLYEFGFGLKDLRAPRYLFFLDVTSPTQLKFRCFLTGCGSTLEHRFKNVDCRILEYFINSSLLQRQIFSPSAVKAVTEILRSDPYIMIDLVHIIRLQLLSTPEHDPHTTYKWSVKLLLTAPITINSIQQGHPGVTVTSKRATVFIQLTENGDREGRREPVKFVVSMKRCDPHGKVQLFGPPHSLPHKTVDILKFKSMRIIDDFNENYQVPRPLLLFYALAYLVNNLSLD